MSAGDGSFELAEAAKLVPGDKFLDPIDRIRTARSVRLTPPDALYRDGAAEITCTDGRQVHYNRSAVLSVKRKKRVRRTDELR